MELKTKVISAKVTESRYEEIENVAQALRINKTDLINRAVELYLMSCSQAAESVRIFNRRNS